MSARLGLFSLLLAGFATACSGNSTSAADQGRIAPAQSAPRKVAFPQSQVTTNQPAPVKVSPPQPQSADASRTTGSSDAGLPSSLDASAVAPVRAGLGSMGTVSHARLGPMPPQIAMLELSVSPGFSKEVVRRVLRRHTNSLASCLTEPSAGQVQLRFVITREGIVESARVARDELHSRATTLCFVRAARRWQFPRPERSSSVEYLFEVYRR